KFANFVGWARRRWKRRFSKRPSNTPLGQKTTAAAVVAAEGRFPMKTVAEVIGVSRSNLIERMRERAKKRIGLPPLPDDKLVAEIKAVIAELPQLGLITTTRFTRTRHSDIVHPVSSSQLTEARDRVRSFGGYNNSIRS